MSRRHRPAAVGRVPPGREVDAVEALLASSADPLDLDTVARTTGLDEDEAKAALRGLADRCDGTGLEVVHGPGGWSLRTRPEDSWAARALVGEERTSAATLEVLATIAVFGPMTRHDVERVRGASLSPEIVSRLIERGWIGIVGRRDGPGRPLLWDVTDRFLRAWGLGSRDDLDGRRAAVEEGLVPLPPPTMETMGSDVLT